jgi:hypothetical protein
MDVKEKYVRVVPSLQQGQAVQGCRDDPNITKYINTFATFNTQF